MKRFLSKYIYAKWGRKKTSRPISQEEQEHANALNKINDLLNRSYSTSANPKKDMAILYYTTMLNEVGPVKMLEFMSEPQWMVHPHDPKAKSNMALISEIFPETETTDFFPTNKNLN